VEMRPIKTLLQSAEPLYSAAFGASSAAAAGCSVFSSAGAAGAAASAVPEPAAGASLSEEVQRVYEAMHQCP
jgi:hypothetical protein